VAGRTPMEVLIPPRVMEVRIGAAHPPSAEAAAEVGDPGRKALVVHTAGAAVVAGAAAGKSSGATTYEGTLLSGTGEIS
jgi:hypothetical protein